MTVGLGGREGCVLLVIRNLVAMSGEETDILFSGVSSRWREFFKAVNRCKMSVRLAFEMIISSTSCLIVVSASIRLAVVSSYFVSKVSVIFMTGSTKIRYPVFRSNLSSDVID